MAISRNLFPALLICAIFACNSNIQKTTFDSKKWFKRDSMRYVFRDTMLKDLVGQRKIKGLTRDELIALLGKPENYNGRDKQRSEDENIRMTKASIMLKTDKKAKKKLIKQNKKWL